MSLSVDVALDGARSPLARARVAELARAVLRAEGVRDGLLSIALVSTRRIQALNRKHLRRSGATDVIAFGFARVGKRGPVVGDVYIAPDIARESARQNGISVREELARLVVHGTLHVLGYDHPDDDTRTSSAMWRRQERLVARLGRGGKAR
jgi:probable rRNA maturation factor